MIYIQNILLTVFLLYSVWMLIIMLGWLLAQKNQIAVEKQMTKFTVIIPFRNESVNVVSLVKSLSKLDYNKNDVEFIFINDHSTDQGEEALNKTLQDFPFTNRVIQLESTIQGKKKAIEKGVSLASNSFIVTTDADCTHSKSWLLDLNKLTGANYDFIIAPVINVEKQGLLSNLQQIESLLLAGVTVGSAHLNMPMLCSGANLAYSKSLFINLDPYQNNHKIMSGDDMFLLEKVIKSETSINIGINTDTIVQTKPANSLSEMFSRSIRWASKSSQLSMSKTTIFGAIVLITNYSILFMAAMVILGGDSIVFFIKLCGVKTIIDVLFLVLLANRYRRYQVLLYFPLMVVFYPFYLLAVSVGTIFSSPGWKGR